jgi:phage N-6-adenine-methyltransferase
MNPAVHFSSAKMEWETPHYVFDPLDEEFGFTCDVCALPENAKCACFYTPAQDGLCQRWTGVCWCNPPYGREIGPWVRKAYESARDGDCTVCCLVPARTDTRWWHLYVTRSYEIRFFRGRIKFRGSANSAPFPSALVVFRPGRHRAPRVRFVDLEEVQKSLFGC